MRTVLEGSVRQAGMRLRITAQLIDVGDDPGHPLTLVELIYALAFQRKFDEALTVVQDAIRIHGPIKAFVPLLGVVHALAGRRGDAMRCRYWRAWKRSAEQPM